MTRVLDALRHEHEVILDAIELMERAVVLPETQDIDTALFGKLVIFLREYADRSHHGKEEDILFPIMRRNEMLARLADMLVEEHVGGRKLVAAIESALAQPTKHDRLRNAVLDYAQFIRDHIAKENEIVFVAAEHDLDESELEMLRRGLAEFASAETSL
jgi:hemerythrin-like domain-containing protein